MNGLNLSEKEKRWLTRLETDYKGRILRNIIGAILLIVSIIYFIKYIQYGDSNDFHNTIVYFLLGAIFIVVQHTYKTYYTIIMKMKDYIKALEKKNNVT